MQGQRRFDSKLYYQLSLERMVPEDHLLRLIADAVDFSFIRPLCRPFYSRVGKPSVDPVVLVKMLLVGYLYGITSERRLAREVSLNLAYRWFLGYDFDEATPNHSVLSKARARFSAEVFEEIFRRSIELCRQAGLLDEGPVYVDSTLMRASASLDSMTHRADAIRPPLSVEEYLQRLNEEDDPPPPDPPLPPPDSDSTAEAAPEEPSTAARMPPNRELQSRTDPDATVVNRPEFGQHLAYKAHVAVAGRRGRVITAAVATTGAAADEHHLGDVLWHHRRLSKLGVPELVVDAKYGTTANFLYLGRLGIPAFMPTTRFGNMRKDIWGRDRFAWLPDEDAYRCPAGQKLRRSVNSRDTGRVQYRAPKGSCAVCAFREQCAPSGRERTIHRSWAQEFVDEAENRMVSPLGKQRMGERKTRIEGVFALGKELHGLRQTRFRGTWRVQIQLWLMAAAMNIKRAVKSLRPRGSVAPALQVLLAWVASLVFRPRQPRLLPI